MPDGGTGGFSCRQQELGRVSGSRREEGGIQEALLCVATEWAEVGWAMRAYRPLSILKSQSP